MNPTHTFTPLAPLPAVYDAIERRTRELVRLLAQGDPALIDADIITLAMEVAVEELEAVAPTSTTRPQSITTVLRSFLGAAA